MEDIEKQVRAGVEAVVNPLKDELRKAASDEVATKLDPVAKDLAEVRSDLLKLQERGDIKPTDDKVKELETRQIALEESVRLMRITPTMPAKDKNGKEIADFRGAFISKPDELKAALREFRVGLDRGQAESRAISSALFSTGGRLPPEVADTFIDYLVEFQVALSRCQTRRMMGPEGHTDELTIASRRIRKATEGVEPSDSNAIGTKRRTLTTVEVIWAESITLTFLEDNVERAGAEGHIARMLATQFGNDLNDLAWNGDQADTADAFRAINNGWITIMQGDSEVNDVDFSDTAILSNTALETDATSMLKAMSLAVPNKFKALPDLVYWTPVRFAEEFADQLSVRETGLGDSVIVGGFPAMRYFGRQVIAEPHLYDENADKAVLTPARNLVFGIQRQMTVESEWKPRKRSVEYTITARADYELGTGSAVVLGSNLPAGLRSV